MSPHIQQSKAVSSHRLNFNADAAAILIAIVLAAAIRLNVIHRIGW